MSMFPYRRAGVRFHGFGSVDYVALAVSVGGCLLSGSIESKMRCAWNAILSAASRTDTGGDLLLAASTGTCSSFLTAVGLNATSASGVCAALSPVWNTFQRWATDELYAIQNERYMATRRIEEIPLAEGGGYRIVGDDGSVVRVCPILTTTAGWILRELAPGETCGQFQTTTDSSGHPRPVLRMSWTRPEKKPAAPASKGSTVAVVGGVGLVGVLLYLFLV